MHDGRAHVRRPLPTAFGCVVLEKGAWPVLVLDTHTDQAGVQWTEVVIGGIPAHSEGILGGS